MNIKEKIINKIEKISIIGLGYVGMPLAVSFSEKKIDVIGFDLNQEKILLYKNGIDPTNEIGNQRLSQTNIFFTDNESELQNSIFHIVSVPTPINLDKTPDLKPVENASKIVGRNLKKGAIVVFESTVYPGVTEDVCIPILEKESGLVCGEDFSVGYSPERINPGDKENTLTKIVKIVSGIDEKALEDIASVYELVIEAGIHKAKSIKVAEAAKVVENSQRDINIAFMNELAMVFDKMNIDTDEVIEAMNTKWNALKFTPGLVGGHCIGVDPYYFLYEAEKLGYHSQIIQSGRKINDGMGKFVADATIKQLVLSNKIVKKSKVGILGLTFKDDTPDVRNSKVIDIINRLKEYDISPLVFDPYADDEAVKKEYGIEMNRMSDFENLDCLIVAVGHKEFKHYDLEKLNSFFARKLEEKIMIDVKSIYSKNNLEKNNYIYWSL